MRIGIFTVILLSAVQAAAAQPKSKPQTTGPEPAVAIALDSETHLAVDGEKPQINGPHRFVRIGGKTGYHPLSLKTNLKIPTDIHCRNEGSMLLSICPLETLAVAASMPSFMNRDPNARKYMLLGDSPMEHGGPRNDAPQAVFSWWWQSCWHPQMLAAFGPRRPDFVLDPSVMVEHLPLYEKNWYQLALTWNKSENRLRIYVNGILCGATDYRLDCKEPRPDLYLGNTAMAFADLQLHSRELSAEQVAQLFDQAGFVPDAKIAAQLRTLFTVQPRQTADWSPDSSWKLARQTSFTKPNDLNGWIQQGCTTEQYKMKALEITPEGLLVQTPDEIAVETRMYLWSPENYEGDIAVQYDFRPEQDSGLALLVVDASGMQREDFIEDHPPRTTGSMRTIIADRVRNYHWEFFRRTGDVRADLGTQVLVKNPWNRPMGMATLPSLEVNRWHSLLFVKEGAHIRAAIDGQWVFDLHDDPLINSGPVFNYGRVGLRLMYQTRMRFRDVKIWTRDPGLEIAELWPSM